MGLEERQYKNIRDNKKIERIVLGIYTLHVSALLVAAMMAGWNIFAVEILFVCIVTGWFVHLRGYRDTIFRAKFISVIAWAAFSIYSFYSANFISMVSTMTAVIVLLGIFCIPQIIYMGAVFSTVILLYHGLIAQTVFADSLNDGIRVFLHIFSMYVVTFVIWVSVRTQQETGERLLENIHELEIAEQSKDDFMVNVSHEIRTPINAVCGMSEAILQEDIPANVRKDVIDIQTAGRILLSTVSNILDFSELESGKMELAEENYNITSTITDIINMALTLENGRHLELIVDCDAGLPSSLLGDEQKLRRIIMNLLDNAIKFTKEGGILLRVKGRREEYGINLVVSIQDSGIGMERQDMEKIFTSFSQVNSKRNREKGGVGLGLAITQALVRRMGGFLTLKSTPGVGSEFMFAIPQKVLDETPIVSIRNKSQLYAVCYINLEKYNYSLVREGYETLIRHITEQLGIAIRNCRNLSEMKRRMEYEKYTHYFISWCEYCEDREFFEELAKEVTVVLILDYGQEIQPGSSMFRIYKPFTVLSIAAIFNGQKIIQNEDQHLALHHRFVAPEAKVLVVDDNVMNLKVMARILLPYQIKVTMAGSGQEALEKLDTMEFDCVFLDHMMPEMDGVETLHKIRKKPGSYFRSLNVIAFTANAIGGAREMFLSEGFNDFIAKPIELSVLERMLRRYIPESKQIIIEDKESQAASAVVPTELSNTASSPADISREAEESDKTVNMSSRGLIYKESEALADLTQAGIDIQQGMTYCGDKEGFRDIVLIYHSEGPKRKASLEQFFMEKDWKNYVITVHALKSNSRGIGANELAELALNLEMAGKENRIDYIFEHHEELLDKHDKLLHRFEENPFLYPDGYGEISREELQAEEMPEVEKDVEEEDQKPIEEKPTSEELLTMLEEQLESFESEGVEDTLDQLEGYTYQGTALKEMTVKIREKVKDFDFLAATELLNELWRRP